MLKYILVLLLPSLAKTIPIIEFEKETIFPKTSKYTFAELLPLKDATHDVRKTVL